MNAARLIQLVLLCSPILMISCDQRSQSAPTAPIPKKKRQAGPVEHIDTQERIAAAQLIEAVDPIVQEVNLFQAEVRGAFDERQFDRIEAQAKELKESKALFRNGSWKIYSFYEALDDRFHTGDDGYLTDIETHRAWEKAFPDSVTRRTALANLLVSYAWHARGTGYADTVTEEGWKLMGERLDQASKVLLEAKKLGGEDIYWYSVSMRLGTGQGWEKDAFDELLAAAVRKEPGYWGIVAQRAYTLLPRWYGEEGDWEAFAVLAADDSNGLGDEAYARIVIWLSDYYVDVYRDARASWPRTKKGLEILLTKYPEAVTLQNQAARLGTMGRDQEFAKAWFDRLGDSYVKEVWGKPERFVHFRGWAQTGQW